MKLLELMESTTRYFEKNGVESPRLTIELILAEILQKKRLQLYMEFESEIAEPVLETLRPLVKKRAEGWPLEQVLGVTTFAGRRFKITPDVLIPRPETELLLEAVKKYIQVPGDPVVDVGTGSGILAVSLASLYPALSVAALDVSSEALAVAQENGAGLANLEFRQSDLLSAAPETAQLIVANLPYIPTPVLPTLSREVKKEPTLALDGGGDGLDLIRRLIADSRGRTAFLALEIGDGQAEEVKKLLLDNAYGLLDCVKDFTEKERILISKYRG
jgi:release factor glutamine methyltransferase